jgi:hypothetical protein
VDDNLELELPVVEPGVQSRRGVLGFDDCKKSVIDSLETDLMCPGDIPTAVSSVAALVLGLSTTAGVIATLSAAAPALALSPADGVLISVSPLPLDLLLVARVLTVVSLLTGAIDFLDGFRFLLQGLVRPSRLSNFLFWADLARSDLRTRTNTKSLDFKSPFIPALSRIL